MNDSAMFYPTQHVVSDIGTHFIVVGADVHPENEDQMMVIGRPIGMHAKSDYELLYPWEVKPYVEEPEPVGVGLDQFELAKKLERGIGKMAEQIKKLDVCYYYGMHHEPYTKITGYNENPEIFSHDAVERANEAARAVLQAELLSRVAQMRTIVPDFTCKGVE